MYIIYRCQNNDYIRKHTVEEILYFCDFNYYQLHKQLITNEEYIKTNDTICPSEFTQTIYELMYDGLVTQTCHNFENNTKGHYYCLTVPIIAIFTDSELDCFDDTIEMFYKMNYKQIRNILLADKPFQLTKYNQVIDPEFVFYRDSEYCANTCD